MPKRIHNFFVISFPRKCFWDARWHVFNIYDLKLTKHFRTMQSAVNYCDKYIHPEYFYIEEYNPQFELVRDEFFDNTL